ncbi:Phospholipase D, C-terminal [Dillenia turbinata]|uniref:Phospholipase D, C-terminal n=1 Tax=Dillenia turbinata TaxID=194707 RepID=A0AAN8ZM53_9MAGN
MWFQCRSMDTECHCGHSTWGRLKVTSKDPESIDCVKSVNEVAEESWKRFTSEECEPLQGHLKHPEQVDANGNVGSLPGQDTSADVGGKILGANTTLPDAFTAKHEPSQSGSEPFYIIHLYCNLEPCNISGV